MLSMRCDRFLAPCLRRRPGGHLLGVLTVVLAGCDTVAWSSPTYTVRDSAGVQIVENTAPMWRSGEEWTVGVEPILEIGVREGAEEYQFTAISGLFEQRDGRIFVADFRSEVQIYDDEGRFLRGVGRQGGGPGEFQRIDAMYSYRGDSIAVSDGRSARVSVYDREGELGRTVTMPPTPLPAEGSFRGILMRGGFAGIATDGSLFGGSEMFVEGEPGDRGVGEMTLIRLSATGDTLDAVATLEYEMEIPDRTRSVPLAAPFTRQASYTPWRDGIFVGSGGDFEIRFISLEGELERIIRSPHLDLGLTEQHRESYGASQRAMLEGRVDPAALERALQEVAFPPTIPPYAQMLVDSKDHLWVRHHSDRGTPGPETWSVFTPDGFLLGTVQTPERLQVRQIGSDFVLGIWTDELDVRYVRKYSLTR